MRPYSCDMCDYKATHKGIVDRHMDSVHGDVWHSCDQCDYKTKWKDNLKKHLDSGLPGHWYICDQCGNSLCLHF